LTPKMSIKRNVIVEDFADVIDGIYSSTGAAETEGISLKQ
jgi:long-chain acyl-CoA synthetase